jgi:hypothetical protein
MVSGTSTVHADRSKLLEPSTLTPNAGVTPTSIVTVRALAPALEL